MAESELQRDAAGQFTSKTAEHVFEAMPADEPVRARDIADKTGIPRSTVNYNLNRLAEDGKVRKKKFHERRVVWWRDEDDE